MRPIVALTLACLMAVSASCRRRDTRTLASPPIPLSGTIAVDGLSAPVRIVRDRWGVPHVYATSRDDLFVAQGFVQAQDRLFQMDLWRRSARGRLSEVLGANFIERDAMTRRVQYHGDLEADWAAYGADAKAIAGAFVRGINAVVAIAREQPTEEFVLAGWRAEPWSPVDVLNRTDAFLDSREAIDQVPQKGFSDVVAEAIRRVGAPPVFSGFAAPFPVRLRASAPATETVRLKADTTYETSDRELVAPEAYVSNSPSSVEIDGATLRVAEAVGRFDAPSRRYLIHLSAPGWNVIGATAPWRPGVAIGHNDRLAWGAAPMTAHTQDVFEQPIDRSTTRVVKDVIVVKGRPEPFEFNIELTPRGVVVASDRARGMTYTLQWIGFEPGTAPELAALAMDVAHDREAFEAAGARWKAPPRRFVAADADGRTVPARPKTVPALSEAAARPSRMVFAHVLGVTDAARRRFQIGPLSRPADDRPFRAAFDTRSWDASRSINAPGQSESAVSPHYSDLALPWEKGEMVPLVFSDRAVEENAAATLTLVPATSRSGAVSQRR